MEHTLKTYWKPAAIVLASALFLNSNLAMAASYDDGDIQARDAQTHFEDTGLANSCIESGGTKAHCVCVTTILKHELTVRDYKAAVKLFAAEKSAEPSAVSAIKISLKSEQYTPREINSINTLRRKLIKVDGFNQRCEQAAQYFTAPST